MDAGAFPLCRGSSHVDQVAGVTPGGARPIADSRFKSYKTGCSNRSRSAAAAARRSSHAAQMHLQDGLDAIDDDEFFEEIDDDEEAPRSV